MITEKDLEAAAIGWFAELGWRQAAGASVAPDESARRNSLDFHLI